MKQIIAILMLAVGLSTYAAVNCVAVYDKNDEVSIIPIDDASEISFDGSIISIGSYSFNMDLLKKYMFADSSQLGIQDIDGDVPGLIVDPKGIITFDDGMSDATVDVCNVNGIVQTFRRNGNTVDFSSLPPDVYIVKIGQASIKILKK